MWKTKEELKLEREKLMEQFNKMSREELLKYIDENLYFEEDYCRDEWLIYADH